MNFLQLVDYYMDEFGYEDLACRMATLELHPEMYDADDYEYGLRSGRR